MLKARQSALPTRSAGLAIVNCGCRPIDRASLPPRRGQCSWYRAGRGPIEPGKRALRRSLQAGSSGSGLKSMLAPRPRSGGRGVVGAGPGGHEHIVEPWKALSAWKASFPSHTPSGSQFQTAHRHQRCRQQASCSRTDTAAFLQCSDSRNSLAAWKRSLPSAAPSGRATPKEPPMSAKPMGSG